MSADQGRVPQRTDALVLFERLSSRERDVLEWLLEGLTNREIGQTLGISENTVKRHMSMIFVKLQIERTRQIFPIIGRIRIEILGQ